MTPAEFDRNTIIISSNDNKINFRASGSVVKFDGFLKVYQVQETDEDAKNILPEVKVGEEINILKLNDEQHFTDPPPRYSEASLVKKMEELGIGRPSTYASIISVLSTRNYVELINKRFNPTDRGKLISAFLEKLFSKYVDYNFTADLENQLDEITSGKIEWVQVLDNFWKDFYENVGKVKEKRTREVLDLLNESLGALIFERDDKDAIDAKTKELTEHSSKLAERVYANKGDAAADAGDADAGAARGVDQPHRCRAAGTRHAAAMRASPRTTRGASRRARAGPTCATPRPRRCAGSAAARPCSGPRAPRSASRRNRQIATVSSALPASSRSLSYSSIEMPSSLATSVFFGCRPSFCVRLRITLSCFCFVLITFLVEKEIRRTSSSMDPRILVLANNSKFTPLEASKTF
mgnify:CR=1 FL=1